ncbi:MAG TPA: hypothetical protein VFQ07_00665 [Candidatus Polarisedimenticolia bacterium]|nr:hypothetical protein [Candidatus Polarisedimenticolia bacterium]
MALTPCRECRREVSTEAPVCPHCGVLDPWRATYRGTGYEWRSQAAVGGWPLVHVAFGHDARGRMRVARGVVAVGQFAVGGIVVAQFGIAWLLGIGQFVVGLNVVAQFGVAPLFAFGQFVAGAVAGGAFALGWRVLDVWRPALPAAAPAALVWLMRPAGHRGRRTG